MAKRVTKKVKPIGITVILKKQLYASRRSEKKLARSLRVLNTVNKKLTKELEKAQTTTWEAYDEVATARAHYLSLAYICRSKGIDTRIGLHGPLFWQAPDYSIYRDLREYYYKTWMETNPQITDLSLNSDEENNG